MGRPAVSRSGIPAGSSPPPALGIAGRPCKRALNECGEDCESLGASRLATFWVSSFVAAISGIDPAVISTVTLVIEEGAFFEGKITKAPGSDTGCQEWVRHAAHTSPR